MQISKLTNRQRHFVTDTYPLADHATYCNYLPSFNIVVRFVEFQFHLYFQFIDWPKEKKDIACHSTRIGAYTGLPASLSQLHDIRIFDDTVTFQAEGRHPTHHQSYLANSL